MAVLNVAFLAAVLPAVFAMPQHAHMGHAPHKARQLPSGYSTGFPQPSGVPGTAPYPVGNGTVGGPTGTGTVPLSTGGAGGVGGGPVTIQSTINIVPLPITKSVYGSPSSIGSPGSGSGSGPGAGASASAGSPGQNGATCGPATVTITQANTITITVPAPSGAGASATGAGPKGAGSSKAPVVSSPAAPSVSASSAAPFPIGNSSIPVGPSGTASVGTGLPSTPAQVPISQTPASLPPVLASSAPLASSSAPVVIPSLPNQAASSATSAPVVAPSAPSQAGSSSAPQASSVDVNAYYRAPGGKGNSSPAPAPSTTPVSPAQQPTSAVPVVSSQAPVSSAASSSAPAPSSSKAPSSSNTGVKARGILYGGTATGQGALSAANSYLDAGKGAMGWGWNWDSSPAPAVGAAQGTLNVQFVPMLLGLDSSHTDAWKTNAKGEWLMGFNEPDMSKGAGGSEMDYTTCASKYMELISTPHGGSSKLVSPSTTNDLNSPSSGYHYMSNFLQECKKQGCKIDALAFHYYGKASDLDYFKNTVKQYQGLQTQYGIPELWITEMAPTETPTKDQVQAFLDFLDSSESGVARYAFNGLNTGTGQSITQPAIQSCYQS